LELEVAAAAPGRALPAPDGAVPAPAGETTQALPATLAGPAEGAAWRWLALVLGLLWLATLGWALWLRARQRRRTASPVRAGPGVVPTTAELRRALDTESFGEAVRLLQAMARPPAADLDEVVGRLADPVQREALQAMRRALWAGDGDPAGARLALRAAFRDGPRWAGAAAAGAEPPLPPLYPPARDA